MNKLHLANLPTPIQKLERLSNSLNKNIYIKRDDLTDMVASGNKIRKLEYSIADALNQGADTLITCGGLQSNHCRATAALAARLNLKCVLLLRKEKNNDEYGNLFLDEFLGAEIIIKEHEDFQRNKNQYLLDLKKEYEQNGYHPYIIPMGASNGIGTLGYIDAYQEILDYEKENNINFDTIVCALGSGGTYAGLYIGNEIFNQNKDIIGINVCDDEEYFRNEIHHIILETIPLLDNIQEINENHIHIIDGYVGKGYAQTQNNELEEIKKLAMLEGIVLDPVYTGKAYVGLITEIKKKHLDNSKNILFIHTGGIFGLLAKANEF
jgi:D-cysteine desulfhydrase